MGKYAAYPHTTSHRKWLGWLIREVKSRFAHLFYLSPKVNTNMVRLWATPWSYCAFPALHLHFYTLWFYFYFLIETLRQHFEYHQWSLLAYKRLHPMGQGLASPVMVSSSQEVSNQHYTSTHISLLYSGESSTNMWKLSTGHNGL